jgi:pimeloyl-ACP methyl ester carboxylesterase
MDEPGRTVLVVGPGGANRDVEPNLDGGPTFAAIGARRDHYRAGPEDGDGGQDIARGLTDACETADVMQSRPFLMEFDLVGRIAFTELDYGVPPDPAHGPLTTDETFADLASRFPPFESEPCDVRGALSGFDWPTLVISGDRDIRTPRTTADEIVASAPHAELVPVRNHGHSALDTAQRVALDVVQHLAEPRTMAPDNALPDFAARRSVIGRILALRLHLARYLPKGRS